MNTLLDTLTDLSHEFGTADYVQGGGGNTSAKTADTLWVKPSGTTLAGLTPDAFVAMDRSRLARLFSLQAPSKAAEREAVVKEVMAAAVTSKPQSRASVEAPLHDVLNGIYVVHTHPALINGLTCSLQGEALCREWFPEALWVPYVDPGYTLCLDVRQRILEYERACGRQPNLLLLGNHGVFVAGDTPDAVRSVYERVVTTLKQVYAKAGVPLAFKMESAASAAEVEATGRIVSAVMGTEGLHVVYGGRFAVAQGPLSPDHIVYAKSFTFQGPLTREAVESFKAERGYEPRVLVTDQGVFAVGASASQAQLALDVARDGALIVRYAAAFGGARYLDDKARSFIENWEVESYRQKQMR